MTKNSTDSFKVQQFFKQLKILSSTSRFVLAVLILLIGAGLFWVFKGSVIVEAKGIGVTISEKGLYLVAAKEPGHVRKFFVKEGEKVHPGDLLVEVYNPEREALLQSAQIKLDNHLQEYERLQRQIKIEEEALKTSLTREIEANEFILKQIRQEIESLQADLKAKESFSAKGLISYNLVRQAKTAILQKEIDEESVQEKLADLKAEIAKGYRTEEVRNKEREIEEQKKEKAILDVQMKNSKLYSTVEGTVIAFKKDLGELVAQGQPLLVLEPEDPSGSFVIYGYFAIEDGKEIVKGTPVEIEFPQLRENEYGRMLGVVRNVSEYAVSIERLENTLYNPELIKAILGKSSAVLEVIVSPLVSSGSNRDYLWTTEGKHPNIVLSTGMMTAIYAAIEDVTPLYFAFPSSGLKEHPILETD